MFEEQQQAIMSETGQYHDDSLIDQTLARLLCAIFHIALNLGQ